MKYFILILLMAGFVSAVDVNFSCPDEVVVNEEFICSLHVSNGEGIYDVKFYIRGDSGMINRVWVDEGWQRTDWYAKDLIKNGEKIDVKLKIDKKFYGTANGIFKLRESETDKIVFDEDFLIEIIQGDSSEEIDDEPDVINEEVIEKDVEENIREEVEEITLSLNDDFEKKVEIISLNIKGDEEEENLIYISKNARVVDYLAYGFALFLIFIIGVLIWERF